MSKAETAKRYLLFLIGIFIMSMGTAIITSAGLGTSPVSSLPYVLSLKFAPTLGTFTLIVNAALLVVQILLLRKNFNLVQLLQLPVALVFGVFIDFSMSLVAPLVPSFYPLRVVMLLIGCVVIALGITLEVMANVVVLSGEGFVKALAVTLKKDFSIVKTVSDACFVVASVILSFLLMGSLKGVREGTVICALTVGFITKFFSKRLVFLNDVLVGRKVREARAAERLASPELSHIVVTIGREFGSGGHLIGEKIARQLNLPFYDGEIIAMAAQESGFSQEYVAKHEQKMTNSLLYDLVMQNYAFSGEDEAPADALYKAQSKVIRDLAAKGPCVIVGRCADQVLSDCPTCFRVFIHASKQDRLRRIVEEYGIPKVNAPEELQKKDAQRANHYKRYTGKSWGLAENYHVCIDSSLLGLDETVDQLLDLMRKWHPASSAAKAA